MWWSVGDLNPNLAFVPLRHYCCQFTATTTPMWYHTPYIVAVLRDNRQPLWLEGVTFLHSLALDFHISDFDSVNFLDEGRGFLRGNLKG